MGTVGLKRIHRDKKAGLAEALGLIGGIEHIIRHGDRVLIKPNLNGAECCTDPDLVEALIPILRDAGASEIRIGEATFGDARMTDMLFKQTGYTEMAARCGVPLCNLNASEAVEVEVKYPIVTRTLRVAREAVEVDAIVNVPVMKVHYATGITLALKNMKGVLVGEEKRRFHEIGLDKAIVDLNSTIRPRLNIVDAITCMERMGPRGGDLVKLDCVMAGEDAAEVDYVGARIMGFEVSEVRHLLNYMERHSMDPRRIKTAGEDPERIRRPFRKPSVESLIPAAFTVRQIDACSSCMNAFLLSCGFLERAPEERMDIYMGSAPPGSAPAAAKSLAFGNCANAMARGFDVRIRGCPPYPFALKEWLLRRHAGEE